MFANLIKNKIKRGLLELHPDASKFRVCMIKESEQCFCDYSVNGNDKFIDSEYEVPYTKVLEIVRTLGGKGKHFDFALIEFDISISRINIKLMKSNEIKTELTI